MSGPTTAGNGVIIRREHPRIRGKRGEGDHLLNRLVRPKTLGVQGVVMDAEKRVFLVRHTYHGGWHFPGGGVEAGETLRQALALEIGEEAAIDVMGRPRLHDVFFNDLYSRRDYIAVFIVDQFHVASRREPDWEIAEAAFFSIADLPPDTTPEARARLREILEETEPTGIWRASPGEPWAFNRKA